MTMQGTPEAAEGSGFGFPVIESGFWDDTETDPSLGPAVVEAPEEQDPPAEVEETEPEAADTETLPWEAPPEETPEVAADAENAEAPAEEQPGTPEEEGTTSDEPRMYAGKFGTVEDLERGYAESTAWATRASQENGQLRTELANAVQLVQQMAPIVQQKLIEDNPELEDQFRVQEAVQQQLRPMQERQQQEQAAAQMRQTLEHTVGQFRASHPDLVPNSPLDYAWAQTFQDLQLPPTHPVAQEIAYEATKDPGLKKVLKANPHWMQTQEGMEMARSEARRLFPSPSRKPAQPRPAVQKAHVETGGTGAPADGAPSDADSMDRAIGWWMKNRGNPLMGGRI
jgi:hypothetical protein